MLEKNIKKVCKCASCGNEAEMMITCSLEFEEKSPTALHPNSKAVKPSGKNQVKGHAVCSHCGNEADIWVDS